MKIDIRDGISETLALELVLDVVRRGRVSQGEHGKMYYCWVTIFNVNGVEYGVAREVQFDDGIDCFYVDENIDAFLEACVERINQKSNL